MCELYLTKENCRKNQFGQNLPTLPQTAKHISFLRRVSVPCEGNRKGRKAYCGLVRMWSSPCRRDGEVEKSALRAVTSSLFGQERGLVRKVEPSLMVKKDGMILELPSLRVSKDG